MTIPKIDIDQIDYELCRRDYGYYVQYVHEGRYFHGAFTRYLTKAVQDFIDRKTGNAYDILLLSVPPQHSKSMSVTETLPSWYLGKHPLHRVIEVSYNGDFAKRFTRTNEMKIEKFGHIFGISVGNPNAADEFKLMNGVGSFISRGIMSGITGEPCELMIIDDPIKNAEEANSLNIRDKIYEEWLGSCKPRLAAGAKVLLIMTRWHEDDLYGKLLETEQNVRRINFTVECETETDELGRHRGDTLFPEAPMNKTREWWEDFKRSYVTTSGTRALNALYYGRPSSSEGNLFKRSWLVDNLYDGKTMKPGSDCYLVEKVKRIMGFVDTVQVLNEILQRYPGYNALLVEDKANGSAIVDVMKRKYHGVIPVKVVGGKESRANAVAPMLEANNVHLQEAHADMIEECVTFPNGKHDDEVDAMTQALQWLKTHTGTIISVDATFKDANTSDYVSIQVWKRIPTASNVSRDGYDNQVNDILNFGV